MNELNQLENRLRSWTPRPPSARIKARLFPKAAAIEPESLEPISLRWLAPAMALCIAVLILAKDPSFGEPAASRMMPTLALSNLDFAAYFAAAGQNEHNILPKASFDWTNGAHSLTTAPSLFDRNGGNRE